MWEEKVKSKKQSLTNFPLFTRMETMTKILALNKNIVLTCTTQKKLSIHVMHFQEQVGKRNLIITKVHDKSKKFIELGEVVVPNSQYATLEDTSKFQTYFELLLWSIEQLNTQLFYFLEKFMQFFPSIQQVVSKD